MSADLLRRAAAKIRETAAGPFVTSSPWGRAVTSDMGFAVHRGEHDTVALYASRDDAAHIASWHPDVALAVADLLDLSASDIWAWGPMCECGTGCDACDDSEWEPHARAALAVARAYLGEA